ncbi:MAG: SIMPL domain-containing protein [Gammaproteobacteria bacterium]
MLRSDLRHMILLPLGLATALFAASSGAQTLSVEGQGSVEIVPEYARIGASVSHIADSAAAAQATVDRVVTELLTEISTLPVDADTVDAGHINIQPKYRWNPRLETQELLGYEATRLLGFRLTTLDSLGEALQMLAEQGATAVQPPQYGSTVIDEARGRALAIAYEKAKRDALSLATAAGLTLGPPDTISTGSQRPPIFRAAQRAAPAAMDAEMAPRYEPGKLSVSASVSVIFLASP